MRSQEPELAERECSVWYDAERALKDIARAIKVARDRLLEQGVVYPQVDVAAPEALLSNGRRMGHCAIVHASDASLQIRQLKRRRS